MENNISDEINQMAEEISSFFVSPIRDQNKVDTLKSGRSLIYNEANKISLLRFYKFADETLLSEKAKSLYDDIKSQEGLFESIIESLKTEK